MISKLVSTYGTNKWKKITDELKLSFDDFKMSPKQCREKWYNHLDLSLSHEPITDAEDLKIYQLFKAHGPKWVYIASLMDSR